MHVGNMIILCFPWSLHIIMLKAAPGGCVSGQGWAAAVPPGRQSEATLVWRHRGPPQFGLVAWPSQNT